MIQGGRRKSPALFIIREEEMIFRRIDKTTINCIISEEDLKAQGIKIDDLFARKEAAMTFLHSVLSQAEKQVDFHPSGAFTSMKMSILPDHSVSLTLSENPPEQLESFLKDLQEKLGIVLDDSRRAELMSLPESERLERLKEYAVHDSGTEAASGDENAAGEGADAGRETAPAAGEGQKEFLFEFTSFGEACRLAAYLNSRCAGTEIPAALYTEKNRVFRLAVRRPEGAGTEFDKLILSANEFGRMVTMVPEYLAHIKEHDECIIEQGTIRTLSELSV